MNSDYFETTKLIYSKLQDDISREIYSARILYNMTKDEKYLRRLVSQYDPMRKAGEFLRMHRDENAVIFGAGDWGKVLADVFPEIGWEAYIDNNKAGQIVKNLKVLSMDEYLKTKKDSVVIVSPRNHYDEIEAQLTDAGIKAEKIFSLWRVSDESPLMYFEDFMPKGNDEVFVDAGVYDGGTSLDFVKWTNGNYKKIYLFEPSESYYERYFDNVKNLDDIDWIKKGLWSETTTLRFFDRPDHDISTDQGLSGIDEKYSYEDGKWIEIPVTSLDERLGDENVSFIKMDIEGSELEALIGAERVIKRCRPKLAICLYHKLEDPWTIPEIILKYNPEYRLYLRHYSWDMLDTVLYAV